MIKQLHTCSRFTLTGSRLQLAGTATRAILIRMSNLYGERHCQGNNIEAPVRMNELSIQGWGTVGGEGGPLAAPRMVLGGTNIPPWTVRGDQFWGGGGGGGGTNYRVTGLGLMVTSSMWEQVCKLHVHVACM